MGIETPIMHSAVPFIASNANMSPMMMPTAQMQLPLPSVFAYQQPNVQKQPFYDAQTVFSSTAHPMEFRGNYSDVHNQSMSAYQVVASPRDHLMFDETATCATPNANMNINEERFTFCHSPMNYQ